MCFSRRCVHELGGVRQIEVDQLSAIVADGVVVTFRFAIVAAGAIAKIDFENQPGVFQVTQRVIDGCVANTGQAAPGGLKDVAGGRVVIALLDDLVNRLSLGSQLRFCLGSFHDGFRLILNPLIVKRGVLPNEIDDLVDVAFKWRAFDVVRRKQFLRLAGVVELFHKKVRHGVMRQTRNFRGRRQH
jgi:hypothetical protein